MCLQLLRTKMGYLCADSFNLQPIDTNRYQFIYRLLLKIDTNR